MELIADDLTPALSLPRTGDRPRENGTTLVGSRCTACRAAAWPSRSVCHRCGRADLVEEAFSPTGDLISCTTVHIARPGIPAPYTLGQIRIHDDGPVVFGQIRSGAEAFRHSEISLPAAVTVIVDSSVTPWYWFEPTEH